MIEQISGFTVELLPFIYLGAPIFRGRMKALYFDHLVDKLRHKLTGWNLNRLSHGGRLILVRSVLTSTPVYTLQVCQPPVAVLNKIEAIIAKFFWGSTSSNRKVHLSKWRTICLPQAEEGIGVRVLSDIYEAFSHKLWYMFRQQNSLWAYCM